MLLFPYAVLLVVYGNAAAYVVGPALPHNALAVPIGLALIGIVLLLARREGLTAGDLGLRRERWLLGTGLGSAVAAVVGAGALLVLTFPPLIGGPVTYAPLAAVSPLDLVVGIGLIMPLATVVPEELAFRGLLLGWLLRHHRRAAAVAFSALAFAAWHAVIVLGTLTATNLAADPLLTALGLAGAFLAVFAGGVLFAALRLVGGSLAAPVAAHWGFNAVLLVGLGALVV